MATSDADIAPKEFCRNTPDACASAVAVMEAVDDAEFDIEFTAAADIDLVVVGVDGILGEVCPIAPDNDVEEFSAP